MKWVGLPGAASSTARVYVLTVAALLGLTGLLWAIGSRLPALPLPLYALIVAAAGYRGGLGPALVAAVGGAFLVDIALDPAGRIGNMSPSILVQVLTSLSVGLLIAVLVRRLLQEREAAREMAEAAEAALRERDALLSLVAHDLRSPLTAIKTGIQVAILGLEGQPDGSERALRPLRLAERQVDRLARLLDDLTTTGRMDGGTLSIEMAELDLAPLVERVATRWRGQSPQPIEAQVARPLPIVGDADRLEQVLDNLIANASKYAPPESTITVHAAAKEGSAQVCVVDRGPGIPVEERARVFERFYRLEAHRQGRQPGLGLGLYISRQLVEGQRGQIWVEDTPGGGASFCFSVSLRNRP